MTPMFSLQQRILARQVLSTDPAEWRLALIDLALFAGQITPDQAIVNSVIEDQPLQ